MTKKKTQGNINIDRTSLYNIFCFRSIRLPFILPLTIIRASVMSFFFWRKIENLYYYCTINKMNSLRLNWQYFSFSGRFKKEHNKNAEFTLIDFCFIFRFYFCFHPFVNLFTWLIVLVTRFAFFAHQFTKQLIYHDFFSYGS